MARTIADIYNSLIAEKDTLTVLSGYVENSDSTLVEPYKRMLANINTQSRVAIWALFLFIVSVGTWVLETLWDLKEAELEAKKKQVKVGPVDWYADIVKEFQYGYTLVRVNKVFQYETIDEAAKIIKYAAVEEVGNELHIKVAKADEPLTQSEKSAFVAYVQKIKIAGTKVVIISDIADDLKFDIEIYFDALLQFTSVKAACEAAVASYLSNLDFNGAFNINKFIDALQLANGVNDIVSNSIEYRYGNLEFASIVRQYVPYSGWLTVIGGIALDTIVENEDNSITTSNVEGVTIKYIPNV
jgi:hypothetical protein